MRSALWLPLLVVLTSCRFGNGTDDNGPPTPLVDDAALLAAIDLRSLPLPALTPAVLGQAGVLSGPTSPTYAVGNSLALTARQSQNASGSTFSLPNAGRITARGQLELTLPARFDPGAGGRLSGTQFARTFNSFNPCALDTVQVGTGQDGVRVTRFDVMTRNPYAPTALVQGSGLRPAFSPPPAFVNALPYQAVNTGDVTEDLGLVVYADGDVDIQGELRCAFSYVVDINLSTQFNLRINLSLKQGWNLVRKRFDATVPRGVLDVYETTLTGDAQDYTFTASP